MQEAHTVTTGPTGSLLLCRSLPAIISLVPEWRTTLEVKAQQLRGKALVGTGC